VIPLALTNSGEARMKSPFPGMDPYLEAQWREVHHHLISFAQAELRPNLPADLRARIGERVFVETLSQSPRSILPDVFVVERPRPRRTSGPASGGVLMAEPLMITLADEPVSQAFIEIREAGTGRKVVTVIEFVSPTNKLPGAGRAQYEQKQSECIAAGVNLVEIDLVRRGNWALAVPPESIPRESRGTYHACCRRGVVPNVAEVYSLPLREQLPAIPIPLREGDSDVPLDLQRLIDLVYEQADYADDLDYSVDPEPPLHKADAQWADELLRSAGRR